MADIPKNREGRGISSIAHHFLSNIHPQRETSERKKPNPHQDSNQSDQNTQHQLHESQNSEHAFSKIAILCDHLECPENQITRFVKQTVFHDGSAGLVQTKNHHTKLKYYSIPNETNDHTIINDNTPIDGAWQELFGQNQSGDYSEFYRCLSSISKTIETIFLEIPRKGPADYSDIIGYCDQTLILCQNNDKQIVQAYKQIKWLIENNITEHISVFVVGNHQEEDAIEIYEKLSSTTMKFLSKQIEWFGCDDNSLAIEDIKEQQLFECEGPLTDIISHWPTQAQPAPIIEQVDPTPADQPSPGLFTEEILEEDSVDIDLPQAMQEVPSKSLPRIHTPMAVDSLPTNDNQLSQQLIQTLDQWMPSTHLDIPISCDLDPTIKVLLDSNNCLQILACSLTESDSLITKAIATKSWIKKHDKLLLGYFNNINLNIQHEPSYIFVTGCESSRIPAFIDEFSLNSSHIYKLLLLQSKGNSSLLLL